MNPTEIIGNLLALWDIVLIAKNSVWNWPVGIANCVFYIALFYPAKLYGDCILQAVYIVLSLFGIYQWLFGRGGYKQHLQGVNTERPITRASLVELTAFAAAFVLGALALGGLLRGVTDTDVPWWDGTTTAACLVATWMLAYRKIENWWVWIGTNISYFFLYRHKALPLTQMCQIIFLATSVVGYVKWSKELNRAKLPAMA